jgi:NADH-quinone oxidoreductase subunit A
MDQDSVAIILYFFFVAATAGAIVALSSLLGRRRAPAARSVPYECGLDQGSDPHRRISVQYFLVAVLFLVFDVEVILLVPWTLGFREAEAAAGRWLFLELAAFIALLLLALLYAWGRRALEWEE